MGEWVFSGLRLKDKLLLLAMLASIVLSDGSDGEAKSREIHKKLKLLNRPAVKSFKSEDGDIVDCVDIYKQPAFDHPALKNHTIQMRPSYIPKWETQSTNHESSPVMFQAWHNSGSCPEGTIPIRRIRKKDLLRATSLDRFGRKNPQTSNAANKREDPYDDLSFDAANRSSTVLIALGSNYFGAMGSLNLWNPPMETNPLLDTRDDYTSAQIRLENGPYGGNYESVEAGWMVNPKLYGDSKSRLFTYWTVDSSQNTGCFNHICPGFVQTNKYLLISSILEPLSTTSGPQYELPVSIFMDPRSGNWWLAFGIVNKTVMGYWPAEIFKSLKQNATMVEWGGEVYSVHLRKEPHTGTGMGSGAFANATNQAGVACYVKDMRIQDESLQLYYPQYAATFAAENNCYSSYMAGDPTDPVLYFGGPGRQFYQDPQCV